MRVSLHYSMTDSEVDFVIKAISWVAQNGWRPDLEVRVDIHAREAAKAGCCIRLTGHNVYICKSIAPWFIAGVHPWDGKQRWSREEIGRAARRIDGVFFHASTVKPSSTECTLTEVIRGRQDREAERA